MASKEFKKGWLSAFIDGEGHVGFRRYLRSDGNRVVIRIISVSNTEVELIKTFKYFCSDLGIDTQKIIVKPNPPWNTVYTSAIVRSESLKRFAKTCTLQSLRKSETLSEIMDWVNRPGYVEKFAKNYESRLRTLYPNHTIRCVAKQLGIPLGSYNTVRFALIYLGLLQPHKNKRPCCT